MFSGFDDNLSLDILSVNAEVGLSPYPPVEILVPSRYSIDISWKVSS